MQEEQVTPARHAARSRAGISLVELLVFMALLGVILAVMASLVASGGNGRRVNDQVNQRATTIETVAQLIGYEVGLAGYRGTGATAFQTNTFADRTLAIQRGSGTDPDSVTVRYYEDRFYDGATTPALVEATYSIGDNANGVPSLLRAENGGPAVPVVTGVASIKLALLVRRTGEAENAASATVVPTDLAGLSFDIELPDGSAGRFLVNLTNPQSAAFF